MIYNNIYETIGNTPIIDISDLTNKNAAKLYLKLEWFNPGGSIKDRIAANMIDAAEKEGLIKPGDTIIEPTSGNTGIGLAMIAAAKGYKAILTMPDSLSVERQKILKGYGAELILTPAAKGGMKESIRVAKALADEHGYFMPMQFDNVNNPLAHIKTTAKEIIKDLPNLTHFIASVGTGGTITGNGQALKAYNKDIQVIAVEPFTSSVISGNNPGKHGIQGIGAGFVPNILDRSVIDQVCTIDDEAAYSTARRLAKKGLFVGISTGANVASAIKLANSLSSDKVVLTVSPDNAERYLSTKLFEY